MAGFLKKLFGGGNDAEDMLQGMMERSEKWQVIGAEIAQDCFQNGLTQGEIVRLSNITNIIKQNHSYNANVVEYGFINKMTSYIDQGVVLIIDVEGGDTVFVHKNHVNDALTG
jgi:hypothetical protein